LIHDTPAGTNIGPKDIKAMLANRLLPFKTCDGLGSMIE